MIRGIRTVTLVALILTGATVTADTLHLSGGGTIVTSSWWVEDGLLYYRNAGGTVGIPRSLVVRIEPGGAGEDPPARPPVRPAPATPDRPDTDSILVPVETARQLDEARAALTHREFVRAADLYESLMNASEPDFHIPRVGYALAKIALGEDDLASAVVLDGLARDPAHVQLLELQGDLLNRQERVQEALTVWQDAFGRSPNDRLREKILKAQRELAAARDYAVSASTHFNVRYDGEVDASLSAAVMDYLEEQYWAMADTFDHTPRQPITVVLYPTQEFRDVTQSAEWVGGIYDGKIRVPLAGLSRLDPRAAAVLRHELTHAFLHSKTRGECPRWLHEGLAQIAEGRRLSRKDEQHVVARLQSGNPAAWETEGFSYPMALSLTLHLQSYHGSHGLIDLLDRLGEGGSVERAYQETFGEDYAAICRRWAAETLEASTP